MFSDPHSRTLMLNLIDFYDTINRDEKDYWAEVYKRDQESLFNIGVPREVTNTNQLDG